MRIFRAFDVNSHEAVIPFVAVLRLQDFFLQGQGVFWLPCALGQDEGRREEVSHQVLLCRLMRMAWLLTLKGACEPIPALNRPNPSCRLDGP